jgi:hypothetical protein
MEGQRTRVFLAGATFLSGILAGTIIDRTLVGGPAWRTLGAEPWAQFSRHADLGTGLIAYPLEAIGATLLLIAALVSNYLDRRRQNAATLPLGFALSLSLLGLLLTAKAAPIMLSVRTAQPLAALQRSFSDFFFWGLYLRGIVDILTFAATIWAFLVISEFGRSSAQ